MTFRELVIKYKKLCVEKNVPEETVMVYLVELSQRDSYNLYMNFENEVPQTLLNEFEKGMSRVLEHEPVQHVLGYSWFYGYKFVVNPNVLIPRVETEELVSYILSRMDEFFDGNSKLTACDIGTGSGALAISLKKEEDNLNMYASDISEEALSIANLNAKNNNADIKFLSGDMLQPFIDNKINLDILICNPPYIPNNEVLEDFVFEHEPHVALFGGEDGLKFYREIFKNCKKILNKKSFMAFEMGYNQKEALKDLLNEYLPNTKFEFIKDINNKNRMLFVYFD